MSWPAIVADTAVEGHRRLSAADMEFEVLDQVNYGAYFMYACIDDTMHHNWLTLAFKFDASGKGA